MRAGMEDRSMGDAKRRDEDDEEEEEEDHRRPKDYIGMARDYRSQAIYRYAFREDQCC